ncbi:MAG TPA: metallopeptidase TldD-related protein [Gemmatimonadales bacterium]|nr:metallopeptidase TldD-related protein [Gemmatimonadales bacterium]
MSQREESPRILSKPACDAIARRAQSFARGGGDTKVDLASWWAGELRWARNRVSLASDRRDVSLSVRRIITGALGMATSNQLDDASLEAVVRAAERAIGFAAPTFQDIVAPPPAFEYPQTAIWSDATYDFAAEARGELARALIEPAEAKGMLSAGYMEVRALAGAWATEVGPFYAQQTQAQCSITVRDPEGTGSGWAGLSSYDWRKIDAMALAQRALQKCLDSRNPVALEPGRYTVILEPQAVHELVKLVVDALGQPSSTGPFFLGYDHALRLARWKLGLKLVDQRVTIGHDPMAPNLGVVPFAIEHDRPVPVRPMNWIEGGVLTRFNSERAATLAEQNDNLGYPYTGAYRLSGGAATVDEMIKTTKRGLLVTRFSNVHTIDEASLLATGLTRDGLWLIENGRITKPVKNLRFTESPLFVLNSLEQLGEPVPVFSPGVPAVVPPLKARDFSFTSMIDAI